MRVFVLWTAPVLVLVSLVFVVVVACQAEEKDGKTHEVVVSQETSTTGDAIIQRVELIDLKQGDKVKFLAKNSSIWVLIPRAKITKASGGTDWAQGEAFVAFKVKNGAAVVQISPDYPISKESDEFSYSIIEEKGGHWKYYHGKSPPRMIIRPR